MGAAKGEIHQGNAVPRNEKPVCGASYTPVDTGRGYVRRRLSAPFRRLAMEVLGVDPEPFPPTPVRIAVTKEEDSFVLPTVGVLGLASGFLCAVGCAIRSRYQQTRSY